MGIDQAVRHVDREIRTARDALTKAKERTKRAQTALDRAKADEASKQAEVDRLVGAKALLSGEKPPPKRRGGAPGENAAMYQEFVAEVEKMPVDGVTFAELRHALGFSYQTTKKYVDRAVREGRLNVTEQMRERSPVLRRSTVINISTRRSA